MISILWVVLTLALVVVLAFKKVNIVAISVLAAAVLALLDGQNREYPKVCVNLQTDVR